ncbi:MAG: NAD-dependent epimerase/dehydratase family protein [Spirochaetes bacterium]|nr:NAD-dependent epimerase/dehydratase family protein [Spirochaetota bacterium]
MNLVTGATGHLGAALLRELGARGEKVRVLLRGTPLAPDLAPFVTEAVPGDIRDLASLKAAMKGVRRVYHLAAVVSIATGGWKKLAEVNTEGTRKVCQACRESGVERLIYTSSVHALPETPFGTPLVEEKRFSADLVHGAYAKSKAEGARAAMEAAEAGLDLVMAHPSGIIGPYEPRPTHMGQMIADTLAGRLPAWIGGGYDFVDVRDVAKGLCLMADKGRRGENYLLTGEPLSVGDLMGYIEKHGGVRRPLLKMPRWLAVGAAPFFEAGAALLKRKPAFTRYSIYTLGTNYQMSHEKATRELGYRTRPMDETLADQIAWIRGHFLGRPS